MFTAEQRAMVGRIVHLQKTSDNSTDLCLDNVVVGRLPTEIGEKVALAINRGQEFTAIIEKAFPIFSKDFEPIGATVDIRVEYRLEADQLPITTEQSWRSNESDERRSSASFFTKVAGVTFNGRQKVVARCRIGETLTLVRDPQNRFDKGAIKVFRSNGEEIGFIPSHVSRADDPSGLAVRMDNGSVYQCRISDLTGGDSENLGVNIEITDEGAKLSGLNPTISGLVTAQPRPTKSTFNLIIAAMIIAACIIAIFFRWR